MRTPILLAAALLSGAAMISDAADDAAAEALAKKSKCLTCHSVDKKDRKSTRLNSSHIQKSRMPSSA